MRAFHLPWVVPLVAASLFSPTDPADAQRGSEPARCSLAIVERVRLRGPGARPWSEFSLPAVLRLSTGQFLVAPAGDPGSIELYGADGAFRRRIGRRGSGPGEFQLPGPILTDATDSIYVFDRQLRRISVLTREFTFHRSFPLPITGVGGATMASDGNFWVQGALGTPKGLGRPVHLVDRLGVVRRSVASVPVDRTTPADPGRLLREIAATPSGVAVTRQTEVRIELWDADGSRRGRLASRPSWFVPWDAREAGSSGDGIPVRNVVTGIRVSDGATIWIHMLRPRTGRPGLWLPPNWTGTAGGERPPVSLPALLGNFRAEVMVVDSNGDEVVASGALDEPFLPGVAVGTVFRMVAAGDSSEEIEVVVLGLRPRANAERGGRCRQR